MQRKSFSKRHLRVLTILGLLTSGIFCLAGGSSASATGCSDGSISCVAIQFGQPVGERSVTPSSNIYAATRFYLPVSISIGHRAGYKVEYTVKVFANGSDLKSGTDENKIIRSVLQNRSYNDLGKDGSEWGIRWNLSDAISDSASDYHPVAGSIDDDLSTIISGAIIEKNVQDVTKQLTLGFAVAVDGSQESGSYSNTITVAIVATPKDVRSLFDISTMQDMTSQICANTTTPARTATTMFDSTGIYSNDANYIPQKILTDTRDRKTYLVRKLADGNCWMSQNLSLNLAPEKELVNTTSDLNSKRTWTPTHTTSATVGEKWGQNDDRDHSISFGWDQYWDGTTGNSSFTTSGATAYGGTAGYAQRGNYYNWFAATAGSGKSTDTSSTTDVGSTADMSRIVDGVVQDSICPRGWTLPAGGVTSVGSTDGSNKSFFNLINIYTGNTSTTFSGEVNTLYASPMNFVPAGYYTYSTGDLDIGNAYRMYWSNTSSTSELSALDLHYNVGTVYPGTNGVNKGFGLSIRCVAR